MDTQDYIRKSLDRLSEQTGVYMFKNADDATLYVGKAVNLKKRVSSYFQKGDLALKTLTFVPQIQTIEHIETVSELDALLLEADLIKKLKPKYNIIWKDDKHPLYIKISIFAEFPKITTVRKEDDRRAFYVGPFPSGRTARVVLQSLRKVFPYCAQNRLGKRSCFYTHLGLCDPCPSVVIKLPPKLYREEKKRYRANIYAIKKILEGKSTAVLNGLIKEMEDYAKKEEYERAAQIRNQIRELRYITQQHFPSGVYLSHPDYTKEEQQKELAAFRELLIDIHHESPLAFRVPDVLRRLECFDISNTMGQEGTGSMVTFVHGRAEKGLYRRFRIRLVKTPNDTAMLDEVLRRRFQHPEWGSADIILVDGGKAQLGTASQVLKEMGIALPVVGLAKRLEELVVPLASSDRPFRLVRLKPGSPQYHLLTRIRDEAHRFAISYHRSLRSIWGHIAAHAANYRSDNSQSSKHSRFCPANTGIGRPKETSAIKTSPETRSV